MRSFFAEFALAAVACASRRRPTVFRHPPFRGRGRRLCACDSLLGVCQACCSAVDLQRFFRSWRKIEYIGSRGIRRGSGTQAATQKLE